MEENPYQSPNGVQARPPRRWNRTLIAIAVLALFGIFLMGFLLYNTDSGPSPRVISHPPPQSAPVPFAVPPPVQPMARGDMERAEILNWLKSQPSPDPYEGRLPFIEVRPLEDSAPSP